MIEIISSLLFPSRIQGRGTTFFEEANLASVTFFFFFFFLSLFWAVGPFGYDETDPRTFLIIHQSL